MKVMIMALAMLAGSAGAQERSLIGGTPAKPGDYPEVVNIRFDRGACTATLVGPQALATAAHCTADGGLVSFTLEGQQYSARCEHAPDYREAVGDQDYALCKVDRPVPLRKFAFIGKKAPRWGDEVTLMGYGCTQPGGTGGNDGILRVGSAPVTRESSSWYYSFHTTGSSAICFGDSGGPAFEYVSAPKEERKILVGVNSRGNIRDESLLTAVYHPRSIDFAERWAQRERVDVCGLNSDCEVQKPEPGPQPCMDLFYELAEAFRAYAMCVVPANTQFPQLPFPY